MPSPTRRLTVESARDLIRERSFAGTAGAETTGHRVGVELEWFTTPSSAPPDASTLHRILDPLEPLPYGSKITFEPGGQVELSSAPFDGPTAACDGIAHDAAIVRDELRAHDIELFAGGFDPHRSLALRTDAPRYRAMRTYFDQFGIAGGRMMCASAAIHVNLDAGKDQVGAERWRTAHAIGPMLLASFANSPIEGDHSTGWKSSRFGAWTAIDPSRTSPVDASGDPAEAWARYALNARVMLIDDGNDFEPILEPLTFAEWIEDGHERGYPTPDDLAYHLTTLFPPVRPHGYIELRMLDMVDEPWWRVAVAVATVLISDVESARTALEACGSTRDSWGVAAMCGLEDPELGNAAIVCFGAALDALERVGSDEVTVGATSDFIDRFVAVGRCPADDLLEPITAEAT